MKYMLIIIECESHPFYLEIVAFAWVTCRWPRIVAVVSGFSHVCPRCSDP